MRSSTETLIAATRILSRDIKSTDGVANAALREVADRLAELNEAERNLATLTGKLLALSAKWKERSFDEEHDWYNDCSSINQFTEELDEILEAT